MKSFWNGVKPSNNIAALCWWCEQPIIEFPVIAVSADRSECCMHCTNAVDLFHPDCRTDFEAEMSTANVDW